jgi:MFS family permease
MLALFIWALGEGIWYINLRQLYLVELGAASAQVGMALALEAAARALLPIPAGYLADRFGTRTIMVSSWFLGIAGTLIGALATTWQMFIPGLVIYAMSAFAVPSLNAYALHNTADPTTPGVSERVLTTIFATYSAGLILSPVLGGLIANSYGIRTCLWVSVAIFAVSTLVVLLTGNVQVAHEDHAGHPLDLLRSGRFMRLMLYFSLAYLTLLVGFQLAPNFLEEVRGFSFAEIGLLFSLMSAGTVVFGLVIGRISPRWNVAVLLALVWIALLGAWRLSGLALLSIAYSMLGAIYVLRTLASASVSRVVARRHQALAFGVIETVMAAAAALASGAAGSLYGLTPGRELPFVAGIVGLPLVIALWFVARAWLAPPVETLEPAPLPTSAS